MRLPAVLMSLAALALACQGPSFTDVDRAAIVEAADAAIAAGNARDWATWIEAYDQRAILMPPNRPAEESRDAIKSNMSAFPAFRDLSAKRYVIEGSGDLAWIHGRYSITFEAAGPDSGKYLQIWRRQSDGSWKIVREMFSSDSPPPASPAPASPANAGRPPPAR